MNSVGQPITRAEGRQKVTGAARYTADVVLPQAVHAYIVHSTIANGRTVSIDTRTAQRSPGVLAVFTYQNFPPTKPTPSPWSHLHPHGQGYLPLKDDKLHYAGQPIALVVATTLDQAMYAGSLIAVEYESVPAVVFNAESAKTAYDPPQFLWPVSSSVGDAAKAVADSAVKVVRTYSTPDRHHNQMEPHATTAVWDEDGNLTLFETTQHVFGTRELVSIVLDMPIEKINVVSQFLGGGFGGKGYVWPHTLLAAQAARVVKRPVRVQVTRAQMYSMVGHQAASIQHVALGADKGGKLSGIRHESITPSSVFDKYIEYAALGTRSMWNASGGIWTNHKIVHTNRNTPTAMRSPHEALGQFAMESAMDELAYETGVDPVALRLINDTSIDPHSGRPFSTRGLRNCIIEGGKRFGWDQRSPQPRSMRDGRYLVGQGMAGAIYTHWRWPAKARVTLQGDGYALVEAGMHDIGTGTYTVMRQVAADELGLPVEKVIVRLGNTKLPYSNPAIGSATMANAGAAVQLAAAAARNKAIGLAVGGKNAPFAGKNAKEVVAADGMLALAGSGHKVAYQALMRANGMPSIIGDGDYAPVAESDGPKAIFSFAAVYAEVHVDEELGLVRVKRIVGAYDAGRIINPRTARSQAIGGITWGVGQALLEQSEMDPNTGRTVHRNYSGYLVPSNADIPYLDVIFAGEFDAEASPLGSKGLGELTAVSVSPAIVNAVYHATGKRIRDLPVTIEKVLS